MSTRQQIQTLLLSKVLFMVSLVGLLFLESAWAETDEEWVAKIVSAQGDVQAKRKDKVPWEPAKLNDTYYPGDMIRVSEQSRAGIVLSNETVIRLDQNTTIAFTGIEKKQTSLLDMLAGAVHFISRTPRTLKVNTPFVDATVEGTEFLIEVMEKENQALLTVFEGQVLATNQVGTLSLTIGQSAIAEAGKAPTPYVVVRPRDAVQWALYYPPILYYRGEDFPDDGKNKWQEMVRESIQCYWGGDLTSAFSRIEKAPNEIHDPRFFNYRAALLLTVGRVEEAYVNVEKALNLAPDDSTATALQSIIATVQKENEKALKLAHKAVETNPDSATAYIALSYAHQANLNLEEALANLQEAVKRAPENGLAWARLSELWLSLGNLDKALESAEKAVSLNPRLARIQTVLGYAYVTQIKIKESIKAFEKAIELDQADPLPRLGLGLAKIRKGKLKEGLREIEIAASLDPNQSIIRSYLGKAYFEEKLNKLAQDQFSMAKELDPLDPTPFFYDAIRKQTQNRPVEALQDLQKSIELNDNRAVYRSRMLLDSDLAARSAGLARIYTDLGFQQLALVEGWKSVNTDPGNYSAHRFLADVYSALPRHEIARVSELLQSQLLQPINITPVQPSLAESDLFILEGSGPTDASFAEFNPLFNRNRLAVQASGVAGGNNTRGDEIVQSGVYDKLSYSIGQFHYETDGFRKNNDQELDIYNLFTQISLSPKTSIQAEFRQNDREAGDLELRFDPDLIYETIRYEERTHSARLGFHHAFTPNSDLIVSSIYLDDDSEVSFEDPDFSSDLEGKSDNFLNELQHLFRYEQFSIISGAGYLYSDNELTDTTTFLSVPTTTVQDFNAHHTNFYIYSQIVFPESVTWTVGGSADFFKDLIAERDQWNPKFGLTWEILPNTTFRAAIFRTLKRTLTTNQTIEPTQVAGFNQLFDDPTGSDVWRYGAAFDQKFSRTLYGGVEFSRRELKVPFLFSDVSDNITRLDEGDFEEHLGRTYLFWTPHPWLAASIEFLYERLERSDNAAGPELFTDIETFRVPLGISFFHPSGFIGRLKPTYIHQKGDFGEPFDGTVESGEDQFWVVDASVGYRLPKRWGLITIEVKNLFDEEFQFQDTDPANPLIIPERLVLFRFTLAF